MRKQVNSHGPLVDDQPKCCATFAKKKSIKGIFIMNKRLLTAAITAALTVAFAVPVFANAFSDVPVKHWAYDSVNQLAKSGVVDGYGDGTFRGDRTMTRYEMAQIVAKAMNKTNLGASDRATLEQLEREFASELNTLGIKVEGLQEQINNQPKISGDARIRLFDQKDPNNSDNIDFRARVGVDGKINDDMRFSARVTSGDMNIDGSPIGNITSPSNTEFGIDTANISYKALTVGRQDVKLGDGYLFDNTMNAVAVGSNGVKLVAGNRYNDGTDESNRIYAAEFGTTAHGAKIAADYYKNDTQNQQIYGVNASVPVGNALSANAGYYKSNVNDDTAVSYGLALPSTGLSATYRNVENGAFTGFGALSNDGGNLGTGGFKGMEYAYDKGIGKNTDLNVKYQDFDSKSTGDSLGGRTTAAVNVKF